MPGCALPRVFQSLPRTLVPGQVFLFPMVFAHAMGMGGAVLQFGGALMVLVVRSVVITSGHVRSSSIRPDLLWASFASLRARSEYSSARSERRAAAERAPFS